MDVSPRADYVALGTRDRLVVLMDYEEGTIQEYVGHGDAVTSIKFHASQDKLYSGGNRDLCQWNVRRLL
jgi:WD40 repeat protein